MEKITSREHLIDYGESRGHKSLVFLSVPQVHCINHLNNHVHLLVSPHKKFYHDGHEDFSNLPEGFFADCMSVAERLIKIENKLVHTALINTCITRENFWVFREAFRFVTGDYEVLPLMKTMANITALKPELALHFPHASVEDPTMLAYTPNHEYGKRDRQVRIKVGKYLQKYYSDILSSEQIRAFANGMKGYEVKWATDSDGFRYVYKHGPSSCMSGGVDNFDQIDGDYHPVDVYDTGEFRLAYIEPIKRKIVARAFVHEPSKRWVRAYGDEGTALAEWLTENGYAKDSTWEGCKIKSIEDDNGNWVLPYIDGDARGVRSAPGGKWEIVSSRPYEAWCDFTSGVLSDYDRITCDCCGSTVDEDDSYWSEYHEIRIGECCIGDYTYAYYRGGQTYVRNEDCIYNNSDDERYEYEFAVNRVGLMQDYQGAWYHPDDLVQDITGEWLYSDSAVYVGVDSNDDAAYVLRGDYDAALVVQYDGAQPIAIWHNQFMPDEIRELYDQDPRITTDNGIEIGLRFRSVDEILLAMGSEYTYNQLYKVGMRVPQYALNYRLEKLTKIAA